ncbi:hypothetical protein A2Y85_01680 [candidate division WOR-3 bacterium RBG_13_43_14]|uniref:Peptidase M23 domain-containing protein n=1 Tax=candidate division WOR-3 bacterium RBG_13_43_14 TaxID=1802590 RepID=A0A1F4U1Q1_UNCW3|nr:MAG: hypothetical protein A2Y85_01680 [candidate division WOR-3 bacterium RBG_13_43_14]
MIILLILVYGWPLAPQDSTQPLGNNYAEYQYYGGSPYLHLGIDVMGITVGKPVYAVQSGIVKAWLTTQAEWHWRIATADYNTSDSCEGWLYAHIDADRYHKNVGQTVTEGELIGYLVEWPVVGFDHCHFSRIKDAGSVWSNPDWAFVKNPLVIIAPYNDTVAPVFQNAYGSNLFALCNNNTSQYQPPSSVTGSIDIIARIYDRTGYPLADTVWERMIPYKIEYEIHGPQNKPLELSFIFHGRFLTTSNVGVIYKDDGVCNTQGDYENRDYYFIVTNTDGDSLLESSDANYSWVTTGYPDGNYWIIVTAYDAAGNSGKDSMMVTIDNIGIVESFEEMADNMLMVIPNPNHGEFRINRSDAILVNSCGQVIAQGRTTFTGLKPGVYFLISKHNDQTIRQKIIVVD